MESRGRWWITAPRIDAREAHLLAARIGASLRAAAGECGVQPDVAIGVATCPQDGRDAATLAAHADVGLYAARAAGAPPAPEGSV